MLGFDSPLNMCCSVRVPVPSYDSMSQTRLYGDLSGLFFVAASPVCDHCVVMDSTACLGNSRPCCDWLECNIVNKHSQSRGMKSLENMTESTTPLPGVCGHWREADRRGPRPWEQSLPTSCPPLALCRAQLGSVEHAGGFTGIGEAVLAHEGRARTRGRTVAQLSSSVHTPLDVEPQTYYLSSPSTTMHCGSRQEKQCDP